jgi:hypothetical protein
MTLRDLASLVGAVLGVAGLLGTTMAVLIAARAKGTIEVLEKDNKALRDRMDTLEDIESDCQKRLDKLEQLNVALTETVTSAAKVDALGHQINGQHEEILRMLVNLGASR